MAATPKTPALAPVQDAPIGLLIGVARQRLKRRLLRDLHPYRLTPAQMGILLRLLDRDGVTPSEIARRTLMDQPMVTRVLDRLERGGLIHRKRDPGDRRRVWVWLTSRGKDVASRMHPIVETVNRELLRNLNRSQEDVLRRLLYRLIRNLEDEA